MMKNMKKMLRDEEGSATLAALIAGIVPPICCGVCFGTALGMFTDLDQMLAPLGEMVGRMSAGCFTDVLRLFNK